MEGEAKEALAAIPGLSQSGKLNPFLLLVSDNNTKLSGRIDQDAFSMAQALKHSKLSVGISVLLKMVMTSKKFIKRLKLESKTRLIDQVRLALF